MVTKKTGITFTRDDSDRLVRLEANSNAQLDMITQLINKGSVQEDRYQKLEAAHHKQKGFVIGISAATSFIGGCLAIIVKSFFS